MTHFSRPGGPFSVLAVVLLAGAAGCGGRSETPPFETVPVRGKVVYKNGASVERLERGKVWFQSTSDTSLNAVGAIGDDGSFTMTTLGKEKGWPGVPRGTYKVRVEPPPDEDRKPQLHLIHPRYLDYEKSGLSFTVPVDGGITIALERPGR